MTVVAHLPHGMRGEVFALRDQDIVVVRVRDGDRHSSIEIEGPKIRSEADYRRLIEEAVREIVQRLRPSRSELERRARTPGLDAQEMRP